jgi:hypothetical protein
MRRWFRRASHSRSTAGRCCVERRELLDYGITARRVDAHIALGEQQMKSGGAG